MEFKTALKKIKAKIVLYYWYQYLDGTWYGTSRGAGRNKLTRYRLYWYLVEREKNSLKNILITI
jgi:hypothetical protein